MKILFFCWGDPTQATTWSNVPFCLTKGLEANGHKVVGYNLNSHPSLSDFWDKHILRYLRKFFKNCQYGFLRTPFAQYFANQIVRNAINQNKDADVCLFTTFSFCNRNKKSPSILFCDWSYESYLNRINHKPFFFEKWFIKHERKCLRTASACVSLFPEATEKINNQLGRKIVSWGGVSAVNILDRTPFNKEFIIKSSSQSFSILFIGDGKYIQGAELLVQTFKLLKQQIPNVELNIIGLSERQVLGNYQIDGVHCYGYLDKADVNDCAIYYGLLREAAVFCNPTEIWGGFSSTIEAMYYYTPVVVSPYDDFVAQFGMEIDFGEYNTTFTADSLMTKLQKILSSSTVTRQQLCEAAHLRVQECDWKTYSARLLKFLNN